jgi:hypothetical protein
MKLTTKKEFNLSLSEYEATQLRNFIRDCKVWDNTEMKGKEYYITVIELWNSLKAEE